MDGARQGANGRGQGRTGRAGAVRTARLRAGLTVAEAARKLGISPLTLCAVERTGARRLAWPRAQRLAALLGVGLPELLEGGHRSANARRRAGRSAGPAPCRRTKARFEEPRTR